MSLSNVTNLSSSCLVNFGQSDSDDFIIIDVESKSEGTSISEDYIAVEAEPENEEQLILVCEASIFKSIIQEESGSRAHAPLKKGMIYHHVKQIITGTISVVDLITRLGLNVIPVISLLGSLSMASVSAVACTVLTSTAVGVFCLEKTGNLIGEAGRLGCYGARMGGINVSTNTEQNVVRLSRLAAKGAIVSLSINYKEDLANGLVKLGLRLVRRACDYAAPNE